MATAEEETMVEGEEVIGYEDILKLQELGVNAQDVKRLKEIKGFTEAKVDKLLDVGKKLHDGDFKTGAQMLEQREKVLKITTGSSTLDQMLGGGIESAAITGTFRPQRIISIAERFDVDGNSVLDNILVARAYNHEQQMHYLTLVAAKMVEDRFSLVVVDSATALFRVDFAGRGALSERQQKLGQHLSHLIKIAEEFNVAVYVTNQVQSDPSGGMGAMFGDQKKPIGGNIMAHACTTRLQLKKGRGEQRICKVYDSPSLPEAECIYQLGEGGVLDAKD